MSTPKNIVFAGNPNVGKSTVFNALTGLKQHTGNWTGKTVDLASGSYTFQGCTYCLYDIPGTYSVNSDSPEEEIARRHICFSDTDLIVVVTDATCLERNLTLTLQILEMNRHVVLCVNLIDEARRNHITVDIAALEQLLGIPAIGISAKDKADIQRLKCFLAEHIGSIDRDTQHACRVRYPAAVESAVAHLLPLLSVLDDKGVSARFLALQLLTSTAEALRELRARLAIPPALAETLAKAAEAEKAYLASQQIPPAALPDRIAAALVSDAGRIAAASTKSGSALHRRSLKLDRLLTSRLLGIPIMLGFFAVILWLTISGANYPSEKLTQLFAFLRQPLADGLEALHLPRVLQDLLINGVYNTAAMITAVMLPPMAIFFPLFTLLEDLGYLPRIAFNLDKCFKKACSCGKQALTMCMGLGCNAVGVTGCRIISSPEERTAAILTNTFMPCNGRFSLLISLSSIFIGGMAARGLHSVIAMLFVLGLIVLGVFVTLGVTKFLSMTLLKHRSAAFTLELPPYRRPQILRTIARSILDRTLYILGRALLVAAPAGLIIWLMANLSIQGVSLLTYCGSALDPFARLMGLDGFILLAFLLAMPANETFLPILLMCYLSATQMTDITDLGFLHDLLTANGWTLLTAVNVMLFSLLHFPCATTLLTIRRETGSLKWTLLGFFIPTAVGIAACMLTTGVAHGIGAVLRLL